MNVRFLDLSVKSKKEINLHTNSYKKFLKKGVFVMGDSVKKFEQSIGKKLEKNTLWVVVLAQMQFIWL